MELDPASTCFAHLGWLDPLRYPAPHRPHPGQLATELALVLTAQSHRTAAETRVAIELSRGGQAMIWRHFATEYRPELSRRQGAGLRLALETVIAAAGAIGVAQAAVIRERRPYQLNPSIERLGPKPTGSSFPSGHAATAFAAATALSHHFPARREQFHAAAANVGRARVYVGAHFPGDVAAGARLGVATARRILRIR